MTGAVGVGTGVGVAFTVGFGVADFSVAGFAVGVGVGVARLGLADGLGVADGELDATPAIAWVAVGDWPEATGGRTEVASQATAMIMARKP